MPLPCLVFRHSGHNCICLIRCETDFRNAAISTASQSSMSVRTWYFNDFSVLRMSTDSHVVRLSYARSVALRRSGRRQQLLDSHDVRRFARTCKLQGDEKERMQGCKTQRKMVRMTSYVEKDCAAEAAGKANKGQCVHGFMHIFGWPATSGIRRQVKCNLGDVFPDCSGMLNNPHIRAVRRKSCRNAGVKTVAPICAFRHYMSNLDFMISSNIALSCTVWKPLKFDDFQQQLYWIKFDHNYRRSLFPKLKITFIYPFLLPHKIKKTISTWLLCQD